MGTFVCAVLLLVLVGILGFAFDVPRFRSMPLHELR